MELRVILTCISAISALSHFTGRPVSRSSLAPAAATLPMLGPSWSWCCSRYTVALQHAAAVLSLCGSTPDTISLGLYT
ncbi:hypothetical protein SAMD00023353_1000520 [Rosellinia necatrix]|uniref:Uncharacterized protein n=1 Tax=Rosellinia necatrix TaxID=77044 RepID=A0A1S8A693_ROSNE|nr:hypothetical protein SAMD00023353_1000520 [Rosellinia necatrix]